MKGRTRFFSGRLHLVGHLKPHLIYRHMEPYACPRLRIFNARDCYKILADTAVMRSIFSHNNVIPNR